MTTSSFNVYPIAGLAAMAFAFGCASSTTEKKGNDVDELRREIEDVSQLQEHLASSRSSKNISRVDAALNWRTFDWMKKYEIELQRHADSIKQRDVFIAKLMAQIKELEEQLNAVK